MHIHTLIYYKAVKNVFFLLLLFDRFLSSFSGVSPVHNAYFINSDTTEREALLKEIVHIEFVWTF